MEARQLRKDFRHQNTTAFCKLEKINASETEKKKRYRYEHIYAKR